MVFRFVFPGSQAKYRLKCHIWDFEDPTLRRNSNFVWVPVNPVHSIQTALCLSEIAKCSSTPLRYYTMWAVIFRDFEYLSKRCNGAPWTSIKTMQQLTELYHNISTVIICATYRRLKLPPRTVHLLLKKWRFFLPYKLQNIQALNERKKWAQIEFAKPSSHRWRAPNSTCQILFFLMNVSFASGGGQQAKHMHLECWASGWAQGSDFGRSSCFAMESNIKRTFHRPFFSGKKNDTGKSSGRITLSYAFPHFTLLLEDYIFHPNYTPPEYSNWVRTYLNNNRPENWLGRGGPAAYSASLPIWPLVMPFRWVAWSQRDMLHTMSLQKC